MQSDDVIWSVINHQVSSFPHVYARMRVTEQIHVS